MKLVQQFKDEIARLKTENARLQAENAELQAENADLQAENADLQAKNARLDANCALARDANKKLTEGLNELKKMYTELKTQKTKLHF